MQVQFGRLGELTTHRIRFQGRLPENEVYSAVQFTLQSAKRELGINQQIEERGNAQSVRSAREALSILNAGYVNRIYEQYQVDPVAVERAFRDFSAQLRQEGESVAFMKRLLPILGLEGWIQ